MRKSTTNRFLTLTVRTLCCVGALTACSAWATVVTWQLNSTGGVVATKDLAPAAYTSTVRGLANTVVTDASHQFSFKNSPASVASENSPSSAATLDNRLQALEANSHQDSPATQAKVSNHSEEASLFAASTTQPDAPSQFGGALASAFDEEFVSVPTVRFEPVTTARDSAMVAMNAVNSDPAPVPEMSALFPIVGLIAAVSCTRILRRRRAAQQSASRSLV